MNSELIQQQYYDGIAAAWQVHYADYFGGESDLA
jgi:hypothetical protein